MATNDLGDLFGLQQGKTFPPIANAALLLGCVFVKLGGSFSIGSNGRRYVGYPCYFEDGQLPQLPHAEHHEMFHGDKEYFGAITLLRALIDRLDKADRDLLFDVFAPIAVDESNFKPSIEEPRRPQ